MAAFELMTDPTYINPELQELLRTGSPILKLDETTDIHAVRQQQLERRKALLAKNTTTSDTGVDESDHQVPTRDGSQITVRVYRKRNSTARGHPVLVTYHGGGWVLGGLDNDAVLCRTWCTIFDGVAVNVDYRLAPEFVFPTALHDCYDALKWVLNNLELLGSDPSKGFILAGTSAGGNVATTISHLYRDEKLSPPLTGLYLSVPILLSPEAVPDKWKSMYQSYEQHADALIINQRAFALFRRLYKLDPNSPLISPVIWPTGHKNLPPTYFQICGSDPLRDEAVIYEKMLREENEVKTRVDSYPGLPHGFWTWWPAAEFSKKQQNDWVEGLQWLLKTGPS